MCSCANEESMKRRSARRKDTRSQIIEDFHGVFQVVA